VYDGRGGCDIYIYPRDLFPTTDLHAVTLVDRNIYIIGNLGYQEDSQFGYTPVYRLDIQSLKIKK
jgi:hypothetical protein